MILPVVAISLASLFSTFSSLVSSSLNPWCGTKCTSNPPFSLIDAASKPPCIPEVMSGFMSFLSNFSENQSSFQGTWECSISEPAGWEYAPHERAMKSCRIRESPVKNTRIGGPPPSASRREAKPSSAL